MTEYNFDKYECIHKEETEFIPIEEIEKDYSLRCINYPYVTHQKKRILIYNIDNKKVKRIITINKLKGKKSILERRLNWKKFGDSGSTTIDKEIFLKNSNDDISNRNQLYNDNLAYKSNNSNDIKIKNNFQLAKYKPPNIVNKLYKDKIKKYIIQNDLNEFNDFSLVLKNFPLDISQKDLEEKIRSIFEKYGKIERVKILFNKNYQIKDICFIDFKYKQDAINLLNSNEKFIIDSCVLSIEKSKVNLYK